MSEAMWHPEPLLDEPGDDESQDTQYESDNDQGTCTSRRLVSEARAALYTKLTDVFDVL